MNKSTEKIKRNFLALSPEKKAESLVLLLELANNEPDKRDRLMALYDSLKNEQQAQEQFDQFMQDAEGEIDEK